MKLQNTHDVGIYCRLSRDDNTGSLESMSIANQKQMLTDYVKEKGWTLKEVYVDDGYSGTNFERPDFKRLLHDIGTKKINCVITKDLSRLGRNYSKVGYYTEEYFIEKGVRFIAVNDGFDTMTCNGADVKKWLDLIVQYQDIAQLDRTILMELIESITIGEGDRITGKRTQDVTIRYRFIGDLGDTATAVTTFTEAKKDIA